MRHVSFLFIYLICFAGCTSEQKNSEPDAPSVSQQTAMNEEENFSEPESTDTTEAQTAPQQLIIPGKSIGLIKLNEDAEVVHKILGQPTTANAAMGKSLQTWVMKTTEGKTYQLSIFFSRNMGNADEKSRAKQLRITQGAFSAGPNAASTKSIYQHTFEQAKPTASYTLPDAAKQIVIFDNVPAGIAFEKNQSEIPIAITVHEPEKPAFEIFSELGSNLQKTDLSQ